MKFNPETWQLQIGRKWQSSDGTRIYVETADTFVFYERNGAPILCNTSLDCKLQSQCFNTHTLESIEEPTEAGGIMYQNRDVSDFSVPLFGRYTLNARLEIASRIAVPLFNKFASEHFSIHSEAGVASAALKLTDELISQEQATRK